MPFKRGAWWWTRIKDTNGTSPQRPLKTKDRKVALAMEALLSTLLSAGETEIVNACSRGLITALQVYDAHRTHTLDQLRAQLSDTDVRQFIQRVDPETRKTLTPWATWAAQRATVRTVAKYEQQVRTLVDMAEPVLVSQLTRRCISDTLARLDVSGSTAKRYHAAWSSFFSYLVEIGVAETNPMRSIKSPRNNPTRDLWLSLADVQRLVAAHAPEYRALAALREGAGVEIGAALRTRVRDVDVAQQVVFIRGSKTETRRRTVRVDAFAWPDLIAATKDKLPDALLCPIWDGQEAFDFRVQQPAVARAYRAHKRALKACKLDLPYTMHDARHSYAVRHMKAGDRPELIAYTLGHGDASQVLKNYGKYRPTVDAMTHDFSETKTA